MTDREIIAQLKNLKSIRPDQAWLKQQSAVLRSQIYNGLEEREEFGFWAKFDLLATRLTTPYAMVAVIALFFLGSGGAGMALSKHAKPGEPLYIAKQMSEKAQFAFAFSDLSKTKLNMEFARERVNELAQIMKESGVQTSDTKVAVLRSDFHKELEAAQARLSSFAPKTADKKQAPAVAKAPAKAVAKAVLPAGKKKATSTQPAELNYFTAATNKNDQHIDISAPDNAAAINDPKDALQKAAELFDKQDYDGAKDILDKANQLLDNPQP